MSRIVAPLIAFAALLSACGGSAPSPSAPSAPSPSPSAVAPATMIEGVPDALIPVGLIRAELSSRWTLVKEVTLNGKIYLIFRSARTLEEARAEYAAQLNAAGVVFTELTDLTGVLFVFAADFVFEDVLDYSSVGLDQDYAALIAVPSGDGTQISFSIRAQP